LGDGAAQARPDSIYNTVDRPLLSSNPTVNITEHLI
jgi:hypothetical protein